MLARTDAVATSATSHATKASIWSLRLAVFFAALALVAGALHRIFAMPTPVLLNLLSLSFVGAGLAIALAVVALVWVWRYGARGSTPALTACAISGALLAWPAAIVPQILRQPALHDISTDLVQPPAFVRTAAARAKGANSPAWPGAAAAALQTANYPDIGPLIIRRDVEESFELAAEAVRRQRMTVLNEVLAADGRSGVIEVTERTTVLGFTDDVVIRLREHGDRTRIDVRSASRYGRHDLGRNAERVRRVLKQIVARVQATVPATAADRVARARERAGGRRIIERKERVPEATAPTTRSRSRRVRRRPRVRDQ